MTDIDGSDMVVCHCNVAFNLNEMNYTKLQNLVTLQTTSERIREERILGSF